jgi:hypothetical protein
MEQRKYSNKDLYGKSGHPVASDIKQGQLGDCYLLASMGSLAFQQPALIESAIRYDAERESFRVSLYEAQRNLLGFKKEPKKVDVEVTQADLAADFARTGNIPAPLSSSPPAVWPAVIETAYAKHAARSGETLEDGFDRIDNGGWPKDALFSLSGAPADQLTGSRLKHQKLSDVYEDLKHDLDEHRPIVLSTNPVNLTKEDGLLSSDNDAGHAYMVEGIRKVDDQVKITLRNPWGHNMHPTHGIHSNDATVEVDLKTITENGHIQVFDRGARIPLGKEQSESDDRRIEPEREEARTGDRELDALLNSLGDPDAMAVALRDLAASPDGQQFRATGQEQYAEQQLEQGNMRQMAAQEACRPVQHGPVMCR